MCSWWLLEKCVKNFPVPTAERNLCSVFWSFCFLYLLLVSSVSSSSTPHAFCSLSGWPKIFCFHPSTSCLFVFSPNKESPVWHVRKKVLRLQTPLDRFFETVSENGKTWQIEVLHLMVQSSESEWVNIYNSVLCGRAGTNALTEECNWTCVCVRDCWGKKKPGLAWSF